MQNVGTVEMPCEHQQKECRMESWLIDMIRFGADARFMREHSWMFLPKSKRYSKRKKIRRGMM